MAWERLFSRDDGPARRWVFWTNGEDVFRQPLGSPVTMDGTPMGARWFCPCWQWTQLGEAGVYPFEPMTLEVSR